MDSEGTPSDLSDTEAPVPASENTSLHAPVAENPAVPTSVAKTREVTASECASCGTGPSQVYALGQIDYDFGTEARHDSFLQHGISHPGDPAELLDYLEAHPSHADALTWVLVQDTTPIYAIMPDGPFAADVYGTLREFLNGQLNEGVERVSIPGVSDGSATLMNGHRVPLIVPEPRGMYSWSTPALVEALAGKAPKDAKAKGRYAEKTADVTNFLERIYYEIRNLGITPQERAINYAATNAFQLQQVYTEALRDGMKLDDIAVERSPICRPGSDCWDVKITFFNPKKRMEEARKVYRFTIDVSDVVPVTVGPIRQWHVY